MQRRKMPGWMVVLFALALVVAGCAETELIIHSAKRVITAVEKPPEIKYKVGNPYQIKGVWYYPREDYQYNETGIASWYGAQFHNRHTANGEVYNMNAVTAAHRTLPLPSSVRVTNLENGRSLILRVNDRGPFARGRIIDISRRGAQLLGFQKQGTAKVRVQIIADRSRALAAQLRNQAQLAKVGTPITVDRLPKPIVKAEALLPPSGGNSSAGAASTPARAEPMASMLVTEPELKKLLNTRPVEVEV
ncbi:MAG: septal ring lytic transglycosylase RlpA family protein [Rhodospirillales bacterium]